MDAYNLSSCWRRTNLTTSSLRKKTHTQKPFKIRVYTNLFEFDKHLSFIAFELVNRQCPFRCVNETEKPVEHTYPFIFPEFVRFVWVRCIAFIVIKYRQYLIWGVKNKQTTGNRRNFRRFVFSLCKLVWVKQNLYIKYLNKLNAILNEFHFAWVRGWFIYSNE